MFLSSAALTFFSGLVLVTLLFWYLGTEIPTKKRWLGLILTVFMVVFCLVEAIPPSKKIQLGLDLKGGTSFQVKLAPREGEKINAAMINQAVEVLRKRVDPQGTKEAIITPQGNDRILIQIPGLEGDDVKAIRKQIEQVAKLDFSSVYPGGPERIAAIQAGKEIMPPGYEIRIEKDKVTKKETPMLVKKQPEVSGEHVARAFAYFDNSGWGVSLTFDSEGAKLFDEVAAQHVNEPLAIMLDGEILSAPSLRTAHFGGKAQITGHYQEQEARDLASALENPLRVPVSIEEVRTVSASLGAGSIRSGIVAGASGLALVAIFMVIYYRFVGFVAIVALLVNCIMVIGFMAMFGSVLTLPGIAGLILSLGIAVDANVLIYERLREELDAGKSLRPAVDASYSKAFSAIFDAHVTQFLTAAILFWMATGPVKGFALTLTIGIVASMFSALLVTYTLFDWAFAANILKKITMLHLIRARKFNFLGNAKPFIIISTIVVILSVAIFAYRGQSNFGADFKGGDLIVFSSTQKLTPDEVRAALASTPYATSVIQSERNVDQDLISVRTDSGNAEKIKEALRAALPSAGLNFEKTEHVGAVVGSELAWRSGIALVLGLVGIFIYVSLRFETSFAFGSLLALGHDLIITLGFFALSGRELSLIMVAALLTIAGYSINDKIVVFDRIRSGLRDRGTRSIAQVMNDSINETLSRTILTGGTVLLTVLALYFFGGPVLNDFAFSFIVGVIVGTYSSIFVAAPLVLWWSKIRGAKVGENTIEVVSPAV